VNPSALPARELAGKTVVVTGAGRGIGRAASEVFSVAGANVVLAGRSLEQLELAARELADHGARAIAVRTDVTCEESVVDLVAATMSEFGRVDVVVNNSGVVSVCPLLETDTAQWDSVFATNLRGTYLVTREFGRHLTAQRSGKVINVASNFAFQGVPNVASYCASKAAVVAFTRSVAVEWAGLNVQVNALAPGYFATDMNAELRAQADAYERVLKSIPVRRMGQTRELQPWLMLLATSASDFMTGETIVIDGGQAAR
jgi:NAD(P)-dependent dehydrogenase (short-subunit alcohol dehydrogenase family)